MFLGEPGRSYPQFPLWTVIIRHTNENVTLFHDFLNSDCRISVRMIAHNLAFKKPLYKSSQIFTKISLPMRKHEHSGADCLFPR